MGRFRRLSDERPKADPGDLPMAGASKRWDFAYLRLTRLRA